MSTDTDSEVFMLPPEHLAALAKMDLFFSIVIFGATTLIFFIIVHIFYSRHSNNYYKMYDLFQFVACLTILIAFILEFVTVLLANNVFADWDFEGTNYSMITSVNICSSVFWFFYKFLFYCAYTLHIEQFFARYIVHVNHGRMYEQMKIALAINVIFIIVSCTITVYPEMEEYDHGREILHINDNLLMIKVAFPTEWQLANIIIANLLIIISNLIFFWSVTRIYRYIWKHKNSNAYEYEKLNARMANNWIFASTILTFASRIILMTAWNGRWSLALLSMFFDCVCMLYLVIYSVNNQLFVVGIENNKTSFASVASVERNDGIGGNVELDIDMNVEYDGNLDSTENEQELLLLRKRSPSI